jgi:hypothetical protein
LFGKKWQVPAAEIDAAAADEPKEQKSVGKRRNSPSE